MKYTLLAPTSYTAKIQKSTFIGHLTHIKTPEEARLYINQINKEHNQATHNCPAYILGKNGETSFCSDAGEPSGTAGKPILNMLQRHNLTNVALVVTRYFGGVKLGVRGLINAYSSTAEQTILTCEKIPVVSYFTYLCTMPYDFHNTFIHKISQIINPPSLSLNEAGGIKNISILDTIYATDVKIYLSVSEFAQADMVSILDELVNQQKLLYEPTL